MQTQNATVIALPAQHGRTAPQGAPGLFDRVFDWRSPAGAAP